MAGAFNRNYLNGQDVFATWGVAIEKGLGTFLLPHEPKERIQHDWPEEPGLDIDLSPVELQAKEVTLRCWIAANGLEDFDIKYAAFFAELSKSQMHEWRVVDHEKTYAVIYKAAKNGDKASGTLLRNRAYFRFDLIFTVQPDLSAAPATSITVDSNGVLYDVYPAGTTYINVVSAGGGVTPSVKINAVNVSQESKSITIDATGPNGYTLQYSVYKQEGVLSVYLWKGTYQSSNTFTGLSSGDYRVRVRLVEATNVYDTWGSEITIAADTVAVPPAETISIDNVTVNQNTVTVLASKSNTTKSIEYSINGNFQTSNVFNSVPNDNYIIVARLVGTDIIATRPAIVNYTPVVSNFNTVLLPGQRSGSITYQGAPGTEFHFNAQPIGTFPATMLLYYRATPLGKVDFNPEMTGQPCAVKYNGILYNVGGGFQDSTVNVS